MNSKSITLNELIDQVKEDLLTSYKADSPDQIYPFLFVDEIEIELNVIVSRNISGAGKLSIHIVEIESGGGGSRESGQKIKVKLSPLVTKEEMRAKLKLDDRIWAGIEKTARHGTLKTDTQIAGPEE